MLQGEHSAIRSTFIKLPDVIKIFVLSIFEWTFNTGFTVRGKAGIFNSTGTVSLSCFGFPAYHERMPVLYIPYYIINN